LGKPAAAVTLVLALLATGCGGGGGGETTAAAPCDDAAFRAQDEELYVTKTAVSNAIDGGGGAPAALLLDLQRARRALGGYLAAHPPCADDLERIAATEQTALDELDAAIAALEGKEDAASHLTEALASLRSAQGALIAGQ
jgi:hypothetical protein